jgi:hypothetical protein
MPFVPVDFKIPHGFQHERFVLRPLLISDVVKDYDAVMTSVDRLQGVFGPQSNWPPPTLTLEQDLIDLGWHHKEFQRRTSFAYTVMQPDESQCLGCAYIYPSRQEGQAQVHVDAEAFCWVRESAAADGLDPVLFAAFKSWLKHEWPFRKVAFPGREQPFIALPYG